MFPEKRMRRRRISEPLRRLSRETDVCSDDLILPVFLIEGKNTRRPIPSMPGVDRISVDLIEEELQDCWVPAVILFGVPEQKRRDRQASAAMDPEGPVARGIRAIKQNFPSIAVITDVCLCAYTDHGHCGIPGDTNGEIDNDATLPLLARMAALHAESGADMVAPSAMMDGQIRAIRGTLESEGFSNTAIMAYAAKFASSFYGPFRDAAESSPSFGDRRTYQIPPANRREALCDALMDEAEGTDWLMVKPALPFLDVLFELKHNTRLPVAAYQVSGEYAMLKHAAARGALDEHAAVMESLLSIKRAGADAVITYYAKEVSQWINP